MALSHTCPIADRIPKSYHSRITSKIVNLTQSFFNEIFTHISSIFVLEEKSNCTKDAPKVLSDSQHMDLDDNRHNHYLRLSNIHYFFYRCDKT